MNPPNRLSAFLAYLLLAIGWIYVLVLNRKNEFAVYHTRQSITIVLVCIASFIIWAVSSWVITFIPLVGAFVAASTFTLVLATFIAAIIAWIVGMIYALQAKLKPVPFFGAWAERLPIK